MLIVAPSADEIVGTTQPSIAVARPGAGRIAEQPRFAPGGQKVKTGAVTSSVHVKIWAHVAAFPQASVAV